MTESSHIPPTPQPPPLSTFHIRALAVVLQSFSRIQLFATPWTTVALQSFPALHYLPVFAQTLIHQVSDAIQPSHPLSSPSPPAFNLFHH